MRNTNQNRIKGLVLAATITISTALASYATIGSERSGGNWNNNPSAAASTAAPISDATFKLTSKMSKPDSLDEKYRKNGDAKLGDGDFSGALDEYDKSLQVNPRNAMAYYGRGRVRIATAAFAQALVDLNKAIAIDSTLTGARIARVGIMMYTRDFANAILESSKVIQADPTNALAYYERGICDGEVGKREDAISDLSKAQTLLFQEHDASGADFISFALGKQYQENGRYAAYQHNYTAALENFNFALNINAKSAATLLAKASVEHDMGSNQAALADYNKAIEVAPLLADAYKQRGSFFFETTSFKAAEEDFTKALAICPNDPELYNYRGRSLEAQGQQQLAAADYQKAQLVSKTLTKQESISLTKQVTDLLQKV